METEPNFLDIIHCRGSAESAVLLATLETLCGAENGMDNRTVSYSYKDIRYSLTRSRRRTTSVSIDQEGTVVVLVPEAFTDEEVVELIESRRKWIYRHLAQWREQNSRQSQPLYASGEEFLLAGRAYRLKVVAHAAEPLTLRDGQFVLRQENASRSSADLLFKAFYREKALERIPGRVEQLAAQVNHRPRSVEIVDLRHRWATCTADGSLHFHWKCITLPLPIIDYVILHQLIYLLHRAETDAFWSAMDNVLPDYQQRQQWLKDHNTAMSL